MASNSWREINRQMTQALFVIGAGGSQPETETGRTQIGRWKTSLFRRHQGSLLSRLATNSIVSIKINNVPENSFMHMKL